MIHNISDLSLLENEEIQAAYTRLKEQGKIRFTGISTHNPKVTLKQALTNDFPQVVLVIYNHLEGPEIEDLIQQVRKKGIGVIAMKVFAGGKQGNLKTLVNARQSYPQAAIRWVLRNPHIDCCIVTMSSYSHVEEYVAVSGQPLRPEDLEIITAYQQAVFREYCRVSCSACLAACPQGVAINDILRMVMYFEDYRMEREALRYYAELGDEKKPTICSSCPGYCEKPVLIN
jgi:predicted aldo/keto reductase-like oxidoreductase